MTSPYLVVATLATSVCLGMPRDVSAAQEAAAPVTVLRSALDRAVIRVHQRSDLRSYRGKGFDRDSFEVRAFKGLRKAADSTIVGWFSGFSSYINGTDSTSCHRLTESAPTGTILAGLPSTMDSADVERWVGHWENAVAASFLSPDRPAVNEEDLLTAIFSVIAKMPDLEITVNGKPVGKPRKPKPDQECAAIRQFFAIALDLEESSRLTLLRGLAEGIEKSEKLPALGQ